MLMTTYKITALDAFCEMDGRKSRYVGEALEWCRGEDTGDLKRSELSELVENVTCLNALEGKFWKSDKKVVMDEKVNPNGVMDEELVQNGVMDEKFVKNFVKDAKIDPNVVVDLSIFKIGGWNSLQPVNQKMLEELNDENEPWLLIGTPCRDPFFVTQYLGRHSVSSDQHVKKLMSLREVADRYWLHEL